MIYEDINNINEIHNNDEEIYQPDDDIRSKLVSNNGDTIYGLIEEKVSNIITIICFDTYIYDKKKQKIRLSEIDNMLQYTELMNKLFAKIVRLSKDSDIKDKAMIFLVFCDYFDMPYHKVYKALSTSIQASIRLWAAEYINIDKNSKQSIVTLFDI
jgi:hypothetical protein